MKELPLPGLPGEPYVYHVVRTSDELEALVPAWRRLFDRAEPYAPFLSPAWQLSWWSAYGAGRAPYVIALHRSGELRALALLFRERSRTTALLKLMGERRLDDLGMLVDPQQPRAIEALGAALRTERDWSYVELHAWSQGREALDQLCAGLGARHLTAVRAYERCPFVETGGGWQALLATKPSRFRKWTRKVEQRATGFGPTRLRVLAAPDLKPDHVDLLAMLERTSAHWAAGTAHFQDPRFAELLRGCLERGVPLTVLLLEIDGRPVAGELLVRHGATDFGLWTAFDPAYPYTGSYVVQETLRRACETGAARFDFLQGDERYKREWAIGMREVDQAVIARPRLPALLRLAGTRLRWAVARNQRLRALALRLRSAKLRC